MPVSLKPPFFSVEVRGGPATSQIDSLEDARAVFAALSHAFPSSKVRFFHDCLGEGGGTEADVPPPESVGNLIVRLTDARRALRDFAPPCDGVDGYRAQKQLHEVVDYAERALQEAGVDPALVPQPPKTQKRQWTFHCEKDAHNHRSGEVHLRGLEWSPDGSRDTAATVTIPGEWTNRRLIVIRQHFAPQDPFSGTSKVTVTADDGEKKVVVYEGYEPRVFLTVDATTGRLA